MFLSDNSSLDTYIKKLEKENVELKKRIEKFEQVLGMNSKNSSKPSSDPTGISAPSLIKNYINWSKSPERLQLIEPAAK